MPPAIGKLDVLTLPDGRKVHLLDQVRENNATTSRYIVQLRGQRATCRSSTVYVADWIKKIRAEAALRQKGN